jgi:hypothetical protein
VLNFTEVGVGDKVTDGELVYVVVMADSTKIVVDHVIEISSRPGYQWAQFELGKIVRYRGLVFFVVETGISSAVLSRPVVIRPGESLTWTKVPSSWDDLTRQLSDRMGELRIDSNLLDELREGGASV